MKPSKILLIATLFLFLVSSCRSVRHEVDKQDKQSELVTTRDQSVTFQDTIFRVAGSATTLEIPWKTMELRTSGADSVPATSSLKKPPRPFVQKSGQATVKVQLTPTGIEATAECDSLAIRAQIRKELIREFERENTVDNSYSKTQEVSMYYLSLAFLLGAVFMLVVQFLKGK